MLQFNQQNQQSVHFLSLRNAINKQSTDTKVRNLHWYFCGYGVYTLAWSFFVLLVMLLFAANLDRILFFCLHVWWCCLTDLFFYVWENTEYIKIREFNRFWTYFMKNTCFLCEISKKVVFYTYIPKNSLKNSVTTE